LYKKCTIPFSCIVFSILAVPLGEKAHHRSVKSRGFTVGLLTVLLYYVLQLGCDGMVTAGKLPPLLGSWIPNLLFALVGISLYFSVAAERPLKWSLPLELFNKRNRKAEMKKGRS